jgi:uncharacterized membrane protein YfcA
MEIVIGLAIGAAAGVLGGLFGIGGGILIVPAAIYLLGFGQQKAQGTSLVALLAPVGVLGVMNYAKAGQIDWKVGILIALGFVGGAFFGSRFALSLDESLLRKLFAGFLVLIAIQLFFKK